MHLDVCGEWHGLALQHRGLDLLVQLQRLDQRAEEGRARDRLPQRIRRCSEQRTTVRRRAIVGDSRAQNDSGDISREALKSSYYVVHDSM
jgi:hypothetical protein